MLFQHLVLVLPLVGDEHRRESSFPRDEQWGTARRLEIPMIESHLICALKGISTVFGDEMKGCEPLGFSLMDTVFQNRRRVISAPVSPSADITPD